MGELAKSFFVINNVEKDSRIINLSFTTNEPASYADCGMTFRTFSFGSESQNYDYAVAGSSQFKLAGPKWGEYGNLPTVVTVNRKTQLEGRVNIYVAPQDEKTKVAVNAKYVLSVQSTPSLSLYNLFGAVVGTRSEAGSSQSVSFSTKEPGTADWGGPGSPMSVNCQSKGSLESSILKMLTPP